MFFGKTSCFIFVAGSVLAASAAGQSAKPAAPVHSAAIPRLADGKPNFNGIWQSIGSADFDLQDHPASAASPGAQSVVEEHTIPYLPDALKQQIEHPAA